jgi:hypothetical protein
MADSNPLAAPLLKTEAPWREWLFPNNEWVLLVVLLIECSVFSVTGNNFLSMSNAFEITRLSVEVGLLALALTPIIISGGIDLSVGSMMGLAAVVMGALWRDAHLPIVKAIAVALIVGLLGGALNALMIARLRFPPLTQMKRYSPAPSPRGEFLVSRANRKPMPRQPQTRAARNKAPTTIRVRAR